MKVVERVRFGGRGQGSLIRYEGSGIWYSAYCVRGKEHRESTRTEDLRQAKRVHRQLLDKVAADRQGLKKFLSPVDRGLRVGEVLDWLAADYRLRHKESPQFRSHLKPVRAHFDDWLVIDLMDESIDAYIEERLEADKGAATINRETQILGQALRLALKRRRIPSMPSIRHLPENNTRQGFFERPEFETLVAVLPNYLEDFTRFAYLTGWRKGEILSLRWADVDRDCGAIRLRPEASKNGKGRIMVLDGELEALIERRWKARLIERDGKPYVTDLVFHRDGEPVGDFRKAWATACFDAELVEPVLDGNGTPVLDKNGEPKLRPSKLFHDLRRTAARNMVRAGVPERVAMEIIGHRTRSMFDRYNIVSEDDLRLAAQKTNLYIDTLPTTRARVALPGNGSR
jgi:integrase